MPETNEEKNQATNDDLVDFKDPRTGEMVKIPKSFQSLLGHVAEASRKRTESELKSRHQSQIDNSSQTLEELQARLQQLEDEKLSEKDRIKKEADREIAKLKTQLEQTTKTAEDRFNLYKSHKIENDLLSVIGDPSIGVANPTQVLALLKAIGQPDLTQTEAGDFQTILKLNLDGSTVQELNPRDAVTKFLSLPGNSNLLKNNLVPGGGTHTTGRTTQAGNQYKASDFESNPALKTEYLNRRRNGENVVLVS